MTVIIVSTLIALVMITMSLGVGLLAGGPGFISRLFRELLKKD